MAITIVKHKTLVSAFRLLKGWETQEKSKFLKLRAGIERQIERGIEKNASIKFTQPHSIL